ncbi:hypothetical protein ACIBF5_08550 [Micromonospora sp. NPDC050417]|uniref:hypothetical protein n=1 Tax=Micromonospora sp. NPDC050417 TaxID=3364280 RepID=UPI0037BA4C5E
MQQSRFVFLSMPAKSCGQVDEAAEEVLWMLVSPNNRQLGRGDEGYGTYAECRAAVVRLRDEHRRADAMALADELTGQWVWRLELDGETVAVSSRSYLRARECSYNLERFLAAVPQADVVDGTRAVRKGQRLGGDVRTVFRSSSLRRPYGPDNGTRAAI